MLNLTLLCHNKCMKRQIFQEFQGAFVENYVAQELARQGHRLYYWTSSGQAELDF